MAGIVRKFFKGKKTSAKGIEDSDGDYAELNLGPTTSSPSPRPYRFTDDVPEPAPTTTPKLLHDETIDNEQSFEQPSHKKRRVANSYSQHLESPSEDSIIEYTQYTLQKWARGEERRQEKRKRKRNEHRVEQENYVQNGMENIKLSMPSVSEVEKLRKERDKYKNEMEKYKSKFEKLEKKYVQLERELRAKPIFQPIPNYLFGPVAATSYQQYQPPPTFQPFPAPSTLKFAGSSSASDSNSFPDSASSAYNNIGPVGPMAPRYADPINSFDYNDDDTSLSDLSNSSKSDTSNDLN